MPDHQQVYRNEAEKYEKLIAREDRDANILKSIQKIVFR